MLVINIKIFTVNTLNIAVCCLFLTSCDTNLNKDEIFGAAAGATVVGGGAKLLGADMLMSALLGIGGGIAGYYFMRKDNDAPSQTYTESTEKAMQKLGFKSE